MKYKSGSTAERIASEIQREDALRKDAERRKAKRERTPMTKEEAVELLETVYMNTQGKYQEAIDIAINALSASMIAERRERQIEELVKGGVDPAYFFEEKTK